MKKQTYPVRIVVINDGSTDDTPIISGNAGCDLINLPYHEESYVSKPEIAAVWNQGLEHAKTLKPDYIVISGADHIYPPHYIETCQQTGCENRHSKRENRGAAHKHHLPPRVREDRRCPGMG